LVSSLLISKTSYPASRSIVVKKATLFIEKKAVIYFMEVLEIVDSLGYLLDRES
jgi:hypothetical protein